MAGVRQEEVDRLWLAALQRLASGLAHELRNALNGVTVNLEVVRTRAARDGVAATALRTFAESAAEQMEQVIVLSEALVSLSRPASQPAIVGLFAHQVATLLRATFANGGRLDLAVEFEGTTRVPADAARLLVAATLQAAVEAADRTKEQGVALRGRVRSAAGVQLAVDGDFASPPRLLPDVERTARELDVAVSGTASSITLTFPA